jgi:hypothetical protein
MQTSLIIIETATASYLLSLVVRVLTSRENKIAHEIEHRLGLAIDYPNGDLPCQRLSQL